MKISKILVSALLCSTITASSFKPAEAKLSLSKAILISLGLTAAYGGYKAYAKKNPSAQKNLNTIEKIGSKAAGAAKYAAGKAIDLSQKAGATIYDNFVESKPDNNSKTNNNNNSENNNSEADNTSPGNDENKKNNNNMTPGDKK